MDISLVITIHDRIELYDLMMFYERKNVAPVITMLGRGTATENQLSALLYPEKRFPAFLKKQRKSL